MAFNNCNFPSQIKEAAEKAVITAKPTTVVKEPSSKMTSVISNNIEKKTTVAINKNTVKRIRTAVNIPSKTTVNKVKKPMSAPGLFDF